jgi:RNA 2',3'-cyclic 3'-phosphodiesterase
MPSDYPAGHLRLFVAVTLPETVRDEILRVQRELQPLVPPAVARWTRPEQLHLTLRFLGNVPVSAVEDLTQSVEKVCRNAPPLALMAKGVGFFPNPRLPRVIWAGINGHANELIDLQKRIETAAGPFSSEPGEKNFAGHITLGRLKNPRPGDVRDLVARAQLFEAQTFGDWTAQHVEIIRSELSSAGARHTLLATFPLGTENSLASG